MAEAIGTDTWDAVRRRTGQGFGLLPASLGELALVLRGRPGPAVVVGRRHALVDGSLPDARRALRVGVHAVLGLLLGALFWWLAATGFLATARGPFYGLVDPGPYDDAWGGPGLVGAWAAHAGAWVGVVAALVLVWWGLAVVHELLSEHLLGDRRHPWTVPVAVLLALASSVLVAASVRQI